MGWFQLAGSPYAAFVYYGRDVEQNQLSSGWFYRKTEPPKHNDDDHMSLFSARWFWVVLFLKENQSGSIAKQNHLL